MDRAGPIRRRRMIPALVVGLALFGLAPAPATDVHVQRYVAGQPNRAVCGPRYSVGGFCFGVSHLSEAELIVRDTTGAPVGGVYFLMREGDAFGPVPWCGEALIESAGWRYLAAVFTWDACGRAVAGEAQLVGSGFRVDARR